MDITEAQDLRTKIMGKKDFLSQSYKPWMCKITDIVIFPLNGNYQISFKYENGKENDIDEFMRWQQIDFSFFD